MSDEFPTLEVALAASVLLLLWRGRLLRRTRLGLFSGSGTLFETIGSDSPHTVEERIASLRRSMRSAAARDLVILGVLASSLLYARSSNLVDGWVFFALGGLATLILGAAVIERLRMDRELARIGVRALERGPAREDEPEHRACSVCGARAARLTQASELGPALWALGARELIACSRCGNIVGSLPRQER